MLLVAIVTLFSYALAPVKNPRFLFNLILPVSYFSIFTLFWIKSKFKLFYNISVGFFVLLPLLALVFFLKFPPISIDIFREVANKLDNCMLASNEWVLFDSLGKKSEPMPYSGIFLSKLNEGYNIIVFRGVEGYDVFEKLNISKDLIFQETLQYIWLRNFSKCMPSQKIDKTYLQTLSEIVPGIDPNPCKILLPSNICNRWKFL